MRVVHSQGHEGRGKDVRVELLSTRCAQSLSGRQVSSVARRGDGLSSVSSPYLRDHPGHSARQVFTLGERQDRGSLPQTPHRDQGTDDHRGEGGVARGTQRQRLPSHATRESPYLPVGLAVLVGLTQGTGVRLGRHRGALVPGSDLDQDG